MLNETAQQNFYHRKTHFETSSLYTITLVNFLRTIFFNLLEPFSIRAIQQHTAFLSNKLHYSEAAYARAYVIAKACMSLLVLHLYVCKQEPLNCITTVILLLNTV